MYYNCTYRYVMCLPVHVPVPVCVPSHHIPYTYYNVDNPMWNHDVSPSAKRIFPAPEEATALDKVDSDVLMLKVINEFNVVLETIRDGVVARATHPKKIKHNTKALTETIILFFSFFSFSLVITTR